MSDDKIEKILATYKPVGEKPGYVWVSENTIVKLETLREIYQDHFAKVGEISYDEDANY